MKTFSTAAEVFEHAQIEQGEAFANLMLAPYRGESKQQREREFNEKTRALSEAARFAAKNETLCQRNDSAKASGCRLYLEKPPALETDTKTP